MPTIVVTYGGHGGGKAGLQLRQVLEGGLHVKLVSQGELEYTLPKELIRSEKRVGDGEAEESFLDEYKDKTDEVLERLLEISHDRKL